MTIQQRRFQARQNQKQQLISEGGPFFNGAFYKDDQEDGFAFTVDTQKGPQNQQLISMLLDTHDKMINDYNKMSDDVKEAEIVQQWEIMRANKDKFNKMVFPEGRKGFVKDIPVEAIEPALLAGTAIHFLTTVGEIDNDNYNGMHFMYDNVRVDIVA